MKNLIYGIDITPFLKARDLFEAYRQDMRTDRDKAGAIQAFEFSYELAWKTMKRLLHVKGIEARSPRDCFREAALIGMISDPKKWFLFIEKRNQTVHTYDLKAVIQIIEVFEEFSQALAELGRYLESERQKSALFES